MTEVTEEHLGFRTGITDETGEAWLEVYVKAELEGECEKQRHIIKKLMCFKAHLSGNFMLYRIF